MKASSQKPSNTRERLLDIMQRKGMKQVDLLRATEPWCKMYGVKMNKSDISQYLSGKTEPTQDKLVILGRALNVCEVWLMGYDVEEGCENKNATLISNKDYDLIRLYNQLDEVDQGKIVERIQTMLEADKYQKGHISELAT